MWTGGLLLVCRNTKRGRADALLARVVIKDRHRPLQLIRGEVAAVGLGDFLDFVPSIRKLRFHHAHRNLRIPLRKASVGWWGLALVVGTPRRHKGWGNRAEGNWRGSSMLPRTLARSAAVAPP